MSCPRGKQESQLDPECFRWKVQALVLPTWVILGKVLHPLGLCFLICQMG